VVRTNAKKHEIDRLVIFAPPRMLGVLRKTSSGSLAGHLRKPEGNLMRLDAGHVRSLALTQSSIADESVPFFLIEIRMNLGSILESEMASVRFR